MPATHVQDASSTPGQRLAAIARQARAGERPWRPLLLYSAYRQLLALLFAVLFFTGAGPSLLGQSDRQLFTYVSLAYLALTFAGSLLVLRRRPEFNVQVVLQMLVDVAAIILLMHASGGLVSGLGTLLAIVVAAAGVLIVGELALFLAAVASLLLLGEQLYAEWLGLFGDTHYTQAGIHGTVFFATALFAQRLASHLRASEAIAVQRGLDLANLAQLNEFIIRRMQSGILVVDADNRIRLVNASARSLFGLEDQPEPERLEWLSPELTARLAAWRADPTAELGTLRAADDETEVIPRFARLGTAASAGTLVFLEDNSSIARQAQQMKQSSLGRLTGSIAHEIRNPLGAISHAAQLLGESARLQPEDVRLVQIITEHSVRVNEIIESVLQLSRRSRSQPETFALGPWVERFLQGYCRDEGHPREAFELQVQPDDVTVQFDPGQLEQILVNLLDNALRHGRPRDGDATPAPPVQLRGGSSAAIRGPYLEVIDHGPGIDEQTARHVFEPFYTTDSRGSGLGLYIARALCEHNFARLDYLRPPAGGSCFRIRFADLPMPDSAP
ncbi:MAG TPA: ATP-binding protein [Gammaproteobacteria bacterium]